MMPVVAELPRVGQSFPDRLRSLVKTNYETPGHNRLAHFLSFFPFEAKINLINKTEVRGFMPKEGPGLVVMNHASGIDPFLAHWATIVVGKRTIRCMARRTLIDPRAVETEKAVEKRTQETADNKPYGKLNPLEKTYREIASQYMKFFNPILVDIGGNNTKAFEEVVKELEQGHLVGIFVQGHRRPPLDLLDIMPGIGVLILRQLPKEGLIDIPIIPMGISGSNRGPFTSININIGRSFRPLDIKIPKEQNFREAIELVNSYIGDRLAELIVDAGLKIAWRLKQAGLSRTDIQEIYKAGISKNPHWSRKTRQKDVFDQFAAAANLIEKYLVENPIATREEIMNDIRFIDENAVFFPLLDEAA